MNNDHEEAALEIENTSSEIPHDRVLNEERQSGRLRQLPKHLLDYQIDFPPLIHLLYLIHLQVIL